MCELLSIWRTKIKNDYHARTFGSMFCKYDNVILAVFTFYSVEQRHLETLFLPFTVNELKLDSEIRNIESYSSFHKTSRKSWLQGLSYTRN